MNVSPRQFAVALAGSIIALSSLSAADGRRPQRYCNPLPIPNYPVGRLARDIVKGEPNELGNLWLSERKEQYRELADPTALWHEGAWYLYPSCDLAWVSKDEGRTWQHHPLNVRDVGYAPTVVKHGDRFLLLASESELHEASSPLGPFKRIGKVNLPAGKDIPGLGDPMLFSDSGRLYLYWGCTPRSGIWGVELDAQNPTQLVGEPRELIPFQPETYTWQRLGNNNQNPNTGWMEGAWMLKTNGRYYLTFSAGGTQYRTYAMACFVGDSPLGSFKPQTNNPILRTPQGLVTGTAHGCVVPGPNGELWAFYTVFSCVVHGFERRIGMDRAHINAAGELQIDSATSTPQPIPARGEIIPWLPLNELEPTFASSSAINSAGRQAVDNSMTTWWLPSSDDAQPTLTSVFAAPATVHAARVIWRDVGLDTRNGAAPGPFRYRIEVETASGAWKTVIDRSQSEEDFLIDYRECEPTLGSRARLIVLGAPKGIQPAVAEFTVFGVTERSTPKNKF
jgi:xylan 1,4-beta-xylosidase